MGTLATNRTNGNLKFEIIPGTGEVAQVAHPTSIESDALEMISMLIDVSHSSEIPSEVVLLVTGGGIVEFDYGSTERSRRQLREPAFLEELHGWTRRKCEETFRIIGKSPGVDLVIGVDVIVDGERGVGQFAMLKGHDRMELVPKRLPVGKESGYLAGVDSVDIGTYPRFFKTRIGSTLFLVCHDVNAANPRTRALIGRASVPTARTRAINDLDQVFETPGLDWALNLVHTIRRRRQTQTFGISHRQLNGNIIKDIRVAAGFGYDEVPLEDLPELLDLMVAPRGMSLTKVLIHS